jgi:hypothetical protein
MDYKRHYENLIESRSKIYSEETRKRMSIAKKGSSPWNKGMIGVSDGTREKMSLRAQNRKRRHLNFFKKIHKDFYIQIGTDHLKILEMYICGYTNHEIVESLGIKTYDIKNVLQTIKNKFEKYDSE